MYVKTRFSGTLISLPSEGAVDTDGDVVFSRGMFQALFDWGLQPVPGLTKKNRTSVIRLLASEIQQGFGLDPLEAKKRASARVDRAIADASA